jgi:predicted ribosomally synthesized peptide with nif11-like leader
MSIEEVKAFFEKVEEDKSLQDKLKVLDQKAKGSLHEAIDELVKIAGTQGFAFSPQDFVTIRNEQSKILGQLEKQKRADCEVFTGVGCAPGMGLYATVPVPPPSLPPQEPCPENYSCDSTYKLHCRDGNPFR